MQAKSQAKVSVNFDEDANIYEDGELTKATKRTRIENNSDRQGHRLVQQRACLCGLKDIEVMTKLVEYLKEEYHMFEIQFGNTV